MGSSLLSLSITILVILIAAIVILKIVKDYLDD